MNLSTGNEITRSSVTSSPLTVNVRERVEQMAIDQGITHLKFTNKNGIELPNTDWIAGVDYDDVFENNNDEDSQAEDEDYRPSQRV